MKRLTLHLLLLVLTATLLPACSGGEQSNAELLEEKMSSLKSLENEIEELQAKIDAENPKEKKRKIACA
jgi:ABC-type glycerol-3-phosphate transport system substrate-binding protein